MGKTYDVRSIIVCDDIREEKSGKEIIIGVYRRVLIVQAFPTLLAKLTIRFELSALAETSGELCSKILSPSGAEVSRIDADVTTPLEVIEGISIVNLHFIPMPLDSAGTYKILFGIGRPVEQVGDFIARPENMATAPIRTAPRPENLPAKKRPRAAKTAKLSRKH